MARLSPVIPKITLKLMNEAHMILADFFVNSEPILLKFASAIFQPNPNSDNNITQSY